MYSPFEIISNALNFTLSLSPNNYFFWNNNNCREHTQLDEENNATLELMYGFSSSLSRKNNNNNELWTIFEFYLTVYCEREDILHDERSRTTSLLFKKNELARFRSFRSMLLLFFHIYKLCICRFFFVCVCVKHGMIWANWPFQIELIGRENIHIHTRTNLYYTTFYV